MTQERQKGSDPGSDPFAGIADLDLVARIIVDGLVSGPHRSPFHGYSAEFSQYRHYQPGDDLKYVDWKLVARTDRVYTKQFRETTNMAASLVVDASGSMEFPEGLSKFRYATIVAAALAHLVSRQGDAVGLVTGGESQDVFLPPRAGRQHLRRILAALSSLKAAGSWTAGPIIRRAAERLKRRGLLIVLSDFYDDEDEAFAELRRAARMGHDVAVFQIVSRTELEFPYARDLEFADLETGETLVINADAARRDYTDVVSAFVERCRKRATAEGIQYSLVVTDTPPERTLRSFLVARRSPG
jgi:uncharacterized protein (DUF58 family)